MAIIVASSVCVGHTGEPCENGWTDRDAIWELQTRVVWAHREPLLDGCAYWRHLANTFNRPVRCGNVVTLLCPFVSVSSFPNFFVSGHQLAERKTRRSWSCCILDMRSLSEVIFEEEFTYIMNTAKAIMPELQLFASRRENHPAWTKRAAGRRSVKVCSQHVNWKCARTLVLELHCATARCSRMYRHKLS